MPRGELGAAEGEDHRVGFDAHEAHAHAVLDDGAREALLVVRHERLECVMR